MTFAQRMELAIASAVEAGKILIRHYDDRLHIAVKESLRDIATEVDEIAEKTILQMLNKGDPSTPILAEEKSAKEGLVLPSQRYWTVDALDGTVNYVQRIPFFAVSIAYVEQNQPKVGVIYNPMTEDLFYGAEGIGVFKNQKPLKVEDRPAQECLFSAAFSGKSFDSSRRRDEFVAFQEVNDSTRGCLRTGSASVNLAYLAEGRFGGCWGKAGKSWDIMAGLLLAKLAGARVETRPIEGNGHLLNYLAAVPSAFDFVHQRIYR